MDLGLKGQGVIVAASSEGIGRAAPSPRHSTSRPLRLMFSVAIGLRDHRAGDVTWHRSLISMRGLSRRLIFRISVLRQCRI